MSRIFAYMRVSTNGQTVENQKNEIIKKLGHSNFEEVEEVESGTKELVNLNQLIESLEAGDTLVIGSIDRLGRKMSKVMLTIEEITRKKVILISIRENVDYRTAMGQFVASVLASVAQLERNMTAERTKIALTRLKEEGYLVHRPTKYGEECRLKAIEMHNAGYGMRAIGKELGCSASTVSELCKSTGIQTFKRKSPKTA